MMKVVTSLILLYAFCVGESHQYQAAVEAAEAASEDEASCPESWVHYSEDGCCVKPFDGVWKPWDEARAVCQREGGDLVGIFDQDFNRFLAGHLKKGNRYWIGVRDETKDGTFRHLDGSIASYTPWASREPNNRGGDEHCVEMVGNRRGAWNDKRCTRKRSFICQMVSANPEATTSTTTTTTTTAVVPTTELTSTTIPPITTTPVPGTVVLLCSFKNDACGFQPDDGLEISTEDIHRGAKGPGRMLYTRSKVQNKYLGCHLSLKNGTLAGGPHCLTVLYQFLTTKRGYDLKVKVDDTVVYEDESVDGGIYRWKLAEIDVPPNSLATDLSLNIRNEGLYTTNLLVFWEEVKIVTGKCSLPTM